MATSGTDLLEVPSKEKCLFFRPKFQGISPQTMASKMVTYLHFRILKFPLISQLLKQIHPWQPAANAAKVSGFVA